MQQAEHIFRDILKVQPNNVSALHFIGVICYQLKEYDSAIAYIKKALQFGPDYADAYNNLGSVLQETGRLDEAITCYQKALHLNPNLDRAHYNLGTAFKEKWHIDDAIAQYQAAIRLNPHLIEAYNNLGLALQDQGRVDEAEEYYRRALQLKPDFALCYSNLLLLMNYNSRHDAQAIFTEHLRFAKQVAEPLYPAVVHHANDPSPSRRLRIGYVSPDFRRHAVNYFIEPVLSSHSHEQFEIFCYADVLRPDKVTEQLQGYADQWRNIAGMPDEQVSELIRIDGIDILVDLAGHTANNRMLVFARKSAPVQVSWAGYFSTTGLSVMDYKIVDRYTDPPGKTERFYTETLVRMPESFLCYLPDSESPEVGPLPALSSGSITFGSFNNFTKVTQEVAAVWADILSELPDSRLLMKGKSFSDHTTCRYAIHMFTQRGIAPERVSIQAPDRPPTHLKAYNLVDIGLDTFPFNGATTTCEAMWMGVPVVTLAGTAAHARAGVSLLTNCGLPDLVAGTPEEYVSVAVNLAGDLKRLGELRGSLRDRMARSVLFDAKRFALDLENCYREMWEQWCNSSEPR
jgi:predicted O-linked N-acetylglucosamine transferase (SPINDLY family)